MKLIKLVAGVILLSAAVPGSTQATPEYAWVEMTVQGRGKMVWQVFLKDSPKISNHFLQLVDKKFYDGLLIHRKVKDFVVQSGDPGSRKMTPDQARAKPGEMGGTAGLGDGGSGKNISFEINDRRHEKYSVGMALEAPMSNTGDSQFFINLKDNFRLDGSYVVFAKVVRGMDVVDSLERGDRIVRIKRL